MSVWELTFKFDSLKGSRVYIIVLSLGADYKVLLTVQN